MGRAFQPPVDYRLPPQASFDETAPTQQAILDRAAELTKQVSEIVHPPFSLDRSKGCEVHQNAFCEP